MNYIDKPIVVANLQRICKQKNSEDNFGIFLVCSLSSTNITF